MTNIEKIEEIEITDEMLSDVEHIKDLYKSATIESCIYVAIQASTQIQDLIAENKRLRAFVNQLANQAITENEFELKDIDTFDFEDVDFDECYFDVVQEARNLIKTTNGENQ